MFTLSSESPDHRRDKLIIILDEQDIDQMRKAKPIEVDHSQYGKQLVSPTVLVCLEEDKEALKPYLHGDIRAIIHHLQRGSKP